MGSAPHGKRGGLVSFRRSINRMESLVLWVEFCMQYSVTFATLSSSRCHPRSAGDRITSGASVVSGLAQNSVRTMEIRGFSGGQCITSSTIYRSRIGVCNRSLGGGGSIGTPRFCTSPATMILPFLKTPLFSSRMSPSCGKALCHCQISGPIGKIEFLGFIETGSKFISGDFS